jgi:hypothetical protein
VHKNIYALKKELRASSLSSPTYIKELTKLALMPANQVKKSIDVHSVNHANNINSINKNNSFSHKENVNSFSPPYVNNLIPFIIPIINNNQSSYLKNVNEFNIRESNGVDPNRVLTFKRKTQKDYNCVNDRNIFFSPPGEIKIEKWPVFYEK